MYLCTIFVYLIDANDYPAREIYSKRMIESKFSYIFKMYFENFYLFGYVFFIAHLETRSVSVMQLPTPVKPCASRAEDASNSS